MKALTSAFATPLLAFLMLFPAMNGSAQNGKASSGSPSDAELEQYVEVKFALRDIQRERQKKVMEAIKSSSLGMKGYRKASTAQSKKDPGLSEEKQKEYEAVKKKVDAIQAKYRKKEQKKIKEMGMDPARYRKISQMKRDKEVRKRIRSIKEQKMDAAQKKEAGN